MSKGYLNIVLHAHLPFVRHPEYPSFFEENWFFEAMTECYLPLLDVFERMHNKGHRFKITFSLSPTLIALFEDELMHERYLRHLDKLIELSKKEVRRTQRNDKAYHALAKRYHAFYQDTKERYLEKYNGDIAKAFSKLQEAGVLELATTAATHGYLPLLKNQESAVRGQVLCGVDYFKKVFGVKPSGFWLPECGYYPGVEKILAEAELKYFFIDTHGLINAEHNTASDIYKPATCPNGIAFFARDPETSRLVWSAHEGYPGDYEYREYHSDIGYDLDIDYIRPYILDGDKRIHTGIKYHRVSGPNRQKEIYNPERATMKAQWHAEDFVTRCKQRVSMLGDTAMPVVITAPYDAELFGHWWHEGPQWLECVIKETSKTSDLELTSGQSYLANHASNIQQVQPSASSWGEAGYNRYWLNEKTDWIYPHLHHAAMEMENLAKTHGLEKSKKMQRALRQANRTLLLAQASDWPFMLKSGTTTEYAIKKIEDYIARLNFLFDSIRKNTIDERKLAALEKVDNIFPEIDCRWYNS